MRILYALGILAWLHAGIAHAQNLDATFGNSGIQTIAFDFDYAYFSDMALQSDGKMVLAGSNNQTLLPVMVARLLPDGNLDPTFGLNGQARLSLGFAYCQIYTVVQTPDAGLLLGGMANGEYALLKLKPDGSPDSSFGTNSRVHFSFGPSVGSEIHQITLLPDGRFLAIGNAYNYDNASFDFAAARFMPDGSTDVDFGTNGSVRIDLQGRNDAANTCAVQADGTVILAGSSIGDDWNKHFAAVRLLSDGTLDPTFGTNGKQLMHVHTSFDEEFNDMLLLDDGSMVLCGRSGGDFALCKLGATGAIFSGFGNQGWGFVDFDDYQDYAYSMAMDAFGRITLAGYGSSQTLGGLFHAAFARFQSSGLPDLTFGDQGKYIQTFGLSGSEVYSLKMDAQGGIIAAGGCLVPANAAGQFFAMRFSPELNTHTLNPLDSKPANLMFPNPALAGSSLHCNAESGVIKAFTLDGRLVLSQSFQAHTWNAVLPEGYYILCIETSKSVDWQSLMLTK